MPKPPKGVKSPPSWTGDVYKRQSLSSVSDKAYSIREGMKTAEQRMKELQKLMEYGRNYQTYKPIQDEYRDVYKRQACDDRSNHPQTELSQ